MTVGVRNGLKVIARGPSSAGTLSREQAAEVFAEVWSGGVDPALLTALLTALRMRGESVPELLGALDALDLSLASRRAHRPQGAAIILPSYNGARRLPVLTPLLALLLAREGWPVLVHGLRTEAARVHAFDVFQALGVRLQSQVPEALGAGQLAVVSTAVLHPGLAEVLALRRITGLRNLAHSLVKMWNPWAQGSVLVGSYTHPEFAEAMRAVFTERRSHALLLRGTEGEPVADPRRRPAMDGFVAGERVALWGPTLGSLTQLPDVPSAALEDTVRWTQAVLEGRQPIPTSVADQVRTASAWMARCENSAGVPA